MSSSGNQVITFVKEKYLPDIRFWIILFFILRLYGISDPPLEIAHNWRQATGNMVARNFYETDHNILYPRVDMAGEKTGITGTEFPVLNYLTYLLSVVFGFHDWFGRLINLVVSSFGVFYFYKLLKLRFDEGFSFHSSFLLLTSMWLMYSRKAMPDTFSASLVIMGLYFAFRYVTDHKRSALVAYFLFTTMGVLSKIPSAYLLVVLIFPLLDKKTDFKYKKYLGFVTMLAFTPVIWWYFYWVPYLVKHFGFWHYYMGTSFMNGFQEIASNIGRTLDKFYFESLKYAGFVMFTAGLVIAIIKKEKVLLWILLLCSFSFLVFMLKAGRNFYHHSYYIIPFVPVMCLFAAYGLTRIQKHWLQILIIAIIVIEGIANQQHDFRIRDSEKYKLTLGNIADKVSKRNELVAINGGDNPQQVYLLHRKGWTITSEQASDLLYLNEIKNKGCKFLFINKHMLEGKRIKIQNRIVYNDENFVVYSL